MFLNHASDRCSCSRITPGPFREILGATYFALLDLGSPVFAADCGLHNLLAVEPVFDATVVDDDLAVVKIAQSLQMLLIRHGCVEIVKGPGCFARSATVFVQFVVEYLKLAAIICTAAIRVGFLR